MQVRHLVATSLVFLSSLISTHAQANKPKCPNVLILLDRSCSMADQPGQDGTAVSCSTSLNTCNTNGCPNNCYTDACACKDPSAKIVVAQNVLQDVLLGGNGVPAPSSSIRFGFSFFPDQPATGSSDCSAANIAASRGVHCDYNTNQTIATNLSSIEPGGGTPTAESINAMAATADLTDTSRPRYMLLLTDGEPGCGSQSSTTASRNAINAVTSLHTQGVTTFVVGFGQVSGNATALNTLNGMAKAGQDNYVDGGTPTAYTATDQTSLANALSAIVSQATGELGIGGCDDSCVAQGCPTGQVCDTTQNPPVCATDVCYGITCDPDNFCREDHDSNGNPVPVCVPACVQGCPTGQACVDGQCLTDNCNRGTCQNCPTGQSPDQDGNCQGDQCLAIEQRCPSDAPYCLYNNCYGNYRAPTSSTSGGAGSSGGANGTGGSGSTGKHTGTTNVTSSGCGCNSIGADGLLAAMLGMAIWMSRRGRRAHRA
jgi:hypothetical protein